MQATNKEDRQALDFIELVDKLKSGVESELDIHANASLKMLNTWHIGGCADVLYYPKTFDEMSKVISRLAAYNSQNKGEAINVTMLGLGSNVLVSDLGISGVVICPTKYLNEIHIVEQTDKYVLVRADCGVTCAKFSKFCQKWQLSSGAFFAGIPGSIGGALFMNAGAWGGETWPLVDSVEVLENDGRINAYQSDAYQISYRKVKGPMGIAFMRGYFRFEVGANPVDLRELIKKRNLSQPIGTLNCGSVFKNPKDNHAAKLIEACGLKGHQIGGAQVSPKHANFIINIGDAKASDVESLIALIQKTVHERYGIELETEVRFLGRR